jgi:hypothetical protein
MLRRATRLWVSVIAFTGLSAAQGLKPKEKVTDYPVSAALQDGYSIGAEYLVHTLPTQTRSGKADALVANDYLVIEIALYGPKFGSIDSLSGTFELRINNQKTTLTPDSPGTVAGSIKFSDWTQKRTLEMEAGNGNAGVTIGPPRTPRFPGDPSAGTPRQSPIPEQNPGGIERDPPLTIEERVKSSSLHHSDQNTPFAGLIYFPFTGKTKTIKTLELTYDGPKGKATLKLE